jgi:hypothetical protein
MPIANTSPTTTVKNVRLKLNEVIEVINTLSVGNEFSSEAFDYGFITTSADVDSNRDYGTL